MRNLHIRFGIIINAIYFWFILFSSMFMGSIITLIFKLIDGVMGFYNLIRSRNAKRLRRYRVDMSEVGMGITVASIPVLIISIIKLILKTIYPDLDEGLIPFGVALYFIFFGLFWIFTNGFYTYAKSLRKWFVILFAEGVVFFGLGLNQIFYIFSHTLVNPENGNKISIQTIDLFTEYGLTETIAGFISILPVFIYAFFRNKKIGINHILFSFFI